MLCFSNQPFSLRDPDLFVTFSQETFSHRAFVSERTFLDMHTEIESAKEEISQIGHEKKKKEKFTPPQFSRLKMMIFAHLKEKKCANASKYYCFFTAF